jgi:uncharacterized protein YndB with AHSA1/START domain
MQQVEVEQVVEAPVERVWARYTDHVSWTEWARMGRVRLEREGEPAPNGVGCVRAISNAGVAVYEEVLRFEPPHYLSYRVVRGGIPIVNHLGEVSFEPHRRGTRILWRCRFDSRIPGLGGAFRLLITAMFRRALLGLQRDLGGAAGAGRLAS